VSKPGKLTIHVQQLRLVAESGACSTALLNNRSDEYTVRFVVIIGSNKINLCRPLFRKANRLILTQCMSRTDRQTNRIKIA